MSRSWESSLRLQGEPGCPPREMSGGHRRKDWIFPNHSRSWSVHDKTRSLHLGTVEAFDHTADVGLRIVADDLDDLFRTAAQGVFDYIVANRDEVRDVEHEPVSLAADDPGSLLVVWLNELIFRCETQHRLYS